MKFIASSLALASALTLAGCTQQESQVQDATPPTTETAQAATLPDGFFLKEAPADAVPLSQARASAKPGDPIAFTGYIGGRAQPFTDGRAIFLVADMEKAPACDDGCKISWDACCVPSATIAANSATVQVVDAENQTLRLNLQGENGLQPGAVVSVVGKVREANEGVLIVDASGIAVTP